MKIVMFEFQDDAVHLLAKLKSLYDVAHTPLPLTEETAELYTDAEIICTFYKSQLKSETLKKIPKLKMIALRHVGFDAVDMEFCRTQGITVCNAAGYGDASIAEHAFALLLDIGKRITESANETRKGNFDYMPRPGFELFGKTLGIVGTGRIGLHAATIGRGFGMEVIAYDWRPKLEEAGRIGFRYMTLDEVLTHADVISLHVPGGPETDGLIDDRAFGLMKQGAVLINTARGSVVDTPALIRSLESGKLWGAGLDVLSQESSLRHLRTLFKDELQDRGIANEIIAGIVAAGFDDVIVTPHNAYNTIEADTRLVTISVDNILAFSLGKPINIVR